jgi:hypothetical protein
MYRFAEPSVRTPFPGSAHLERFLIELFGKKVPRFTSVYDFVRQMRERFRAYLSQLDFFVDTFTIERGHGLVYCLFFFTSHIYGFEKMVEAKWRMDEDRGQGHSQHKGTPLFSEIELSGYPQKLSDFICGKDYRTNQELYRFGLENGFLPKHTNEVLNSWKQGWGLEVFALDGKRVRGNYLSHNTDRTVGFRFLNG